MNIIVAIKQVPESEEMRYDPATRTLVREGVTSVINPFDKRALTEAVRLKEEYGGEITAITMGPPQAREALVECLGRGVDRTIHISDRAFAGSDTLATARTLAAALRRYTFDLILLGKFSTDSETGQVGPEIAELLGLPQVTGSTAIQVDDNRTLFVTRETDTGFEQVRCPLPALLTASERLIKPVKTTPALVEEGERRVFDDPSLIEILSLHNLGLSPRDVGLSGSPTEVTELRPVEIKRERLVLTGDDPESMADSLLLALEDRGLRRAGSAPGKGAALPLPAQAVSDPDTAKSVWAVAEWLPTPGAEDGAPALRRVSVELAGEAARLAAQMGGEAIAFLAGHHVEQLVGELAQHGASTLLLADSPALAQHDPEVYAWLLARAIEQYRPWAVLLPATTFGRDVAPRVAARLGLGLTGDCLGLEIDEEGRLLQLKPAFGGQVVAPIVSRTLPGMATVRPGMLPRYAPDLSRTALIVNLDLEGMPEARVQVLSATYEGEAGLALDRARLVVSVGMGIGGPEALPDVNLLAGALGEWLGLAPEDVAVGGSRKAVDSGWLPRQQQIGITGHSVAPDLYLALGISGKFNHLAGVLGAHTVVAFNIDPTAPIFEAADIGVVGDWRSIAGALVARLGQGSEARVQGV